MELHLALDDGLWLGTLTQAGARLGLPLVAAGDVHLHARAAKPLQGVFTAVGLGRSLADPTVLARYERTHWLASRPTYLATQLVAGLYTSESAPARLARHVAQRIGQKLPPFRQVVAASLTGA